MSKYPILIVLLCLSALSCRYLPFDRELEMTAATLSKLKLEATIGPITIRDLCLDIENDKIFFIPDKESYSSGFIVSTTSYGNANILYKYPDGFQSNMQSVSVNFASPYKPNGFMETMSGYPGYLFCLLYDYDPGTQAPHPKRHIYYAKPAPDYYIEDTFGEINFFTDLTSLEYPGMSMVNGAFIRPADNRLYLLCTNASGDFVELNCGINPSGLASATPSRPDPTPPAILPRNSDPPVPDVFYSYDPTTLKSFISYPMPDGFHNVWWQDENKHRFSDAFPRARILSNSNLLAFDKEVIYGFDQDGNQLYKFPVGNLRYIYEKKDSSGEYYMVFCLASVMYPNGENCKADYTFRIYSYPTKDVAKLNF